MQTIQYDDRKRIISNRPRFLLQPRLILETEEDKLSSPPSRLSKRANYLRFYYGQDRSIDSVIWKICFDLCQVRSWPSESLILLVIFFSSGLRCILGRRFEGVDDKRGTLMENWMKIWISSFSFPSPVLFCDFLSLVSSFFFFRNLLNLLEHRSTRVYRKKKAEALWSFVGRLCSLKKSENNFSRVIIFAAHEQESGGIFSGGGLSIFSMRDPPRVLSDIDPWPD